MYNQLKTNLSLILMASLLIGNFVNADTVVYEQKPRNGPPEFTDMYKPGENKIDIPQINTSQPEKSTPIPLETTTSPKQKTPLKLMLNNPTDQQSIWSGNGDISVSFITNGNAGSSLTFFIYLDGKKILDTSSQSAMLHNIDRGQHQIYVTAQSAEGAEVARTKEIVFYVRRPMVRNNKNYRPHLY